MNKVILPDINSWLCEPLFDFFKLVKNEYELSLFYALKEYVDSFAHECAYLGLSHVDNLCLYPKITFNPETRCAKLEKIFFISEKVKHVLTWNYLNNLEDIGFKKNTKLHIPKEFETNFPGLNFTSQFNGTNYFETKELLLKHSHQREYLKKLIVIENESDGYKEDVLNLAIITFDLSVLKDCLFLKAKRYETFKNLLPPNLNVELPVKLDIPIKQVPQALKNEQLIQLSKLKK